ncbi:3258_t:CDS:2 [Diversispora eburnea]|uniref:3258_t:CDS:1 n=1 Tax=Diversispora eburnea TaxID=1213867 RepID=A0A9N8UWL1_9GLOM|nr:3258_t:CDS:2 [Diversispora eburnea]
MTSTVNKVIKVIDNIINYITYAYNYLLSLIIFYLLKQKPYHVHLPSPTNGYHPAILITGTSSGIGLDTTLTLVKQGYKVFAAVRKEEDAKKLCAIFKELINPKQGDLKPIVMDVTNKQEIQSACTFIRNDLRRETPLIGLINNAALSINLPLEVASEDAFIDSFNTNYFGLINVTKKFLPLLREGHGRVINIGSIDSWNAPPMMGINSSTKAAIRIMTKIWRMETRTMAINDFRNFKSFSSTSPYYYDEDNDNNISPNALFNYSNLYKSVGENFGKCVISMPTEIVTNAIVHALTSPYPMDTYYVGLDSKVIAALSWVLGDRLIEAIESKIFCNV